MFFDTVQARLAMIKWMRGQGDRFVDPADVSQNIVRVDLLVFVLIFASFSWERGESAKVDRHTQGQDYRKPESGGV